jgi:hypothetical protein
MLTLGEQQWQRQRFGSLLSWLERAARRQEEINSLSLRAYYELQRRKRKRAFNYGLITRRLLFWFAIMYGANRLEPLLKEYSPEVYVIWLWACRAVVNAIDLFWKIVALSLGLRNARLDYRSLK